MKTAHGKIAKMWVKFDHSNDTGGPLFVLHNPSMVLENESNHGDRHHKVISNLSISNRMTVYVMLQITA
jgi:hypothetical protein